MIELFASVLSGAVVVSSLIASLTHIRYVLEKRQRILRDDYNSMEESFRRQDRVGVNAIRAQMKDKYRKEQTELVAQIVAKYSRVPLKDALKDDAARDIIYESLSGPDQTVRDTNSSDHTK